MAFSFGGNKKRRIPLTIEEQALAKVLYDAIRRATDKISVQELAKIIQRLDADTLSRLLNNITIAEDSASIQKTLLDSVNVGGPQAISQISKIAPALAFPGFTPKPVKILNAGEMANMDFSNIPAWARPIRPNVKLSMSFNKTNPNSLKFASNRAGQLITSIDELTRISVNRIITEAFTNQIDVLTTASRIKNIIGLHPQYADAVVKFEKTELARLVKAGFKEGEAKIRARARATQYSDKLKKARATTIARTEIQIAQNEGRYEGWKQASEAGYVDPESQKQWIIARDERTCPICLELDGEIVPWNGIFSNGMERPVAHPNCRCTMIILPPDRGTR